ncbi:MAG: hypothetical protein LBB81_04255 [Treponema sp.]|nr:hypothetical protein [Treponema sp.]
MLIQKQTEKPREIFWHEYEEKTGEKVLAHSLGQYICGFKEFDQNKWNNIWGLIIATTGGLRFHHFPKMSWIDAFTRFAEQEAPKEKTFFIPSEQIASARLIKETHWWKRILNSGPPKLVICRTDETEEKVLFEVEFNSGELIKTLQSGST